ncbi:MAG: T9SS type A sorting domain-containing protein [Calditrichaeota bacterium]|nr:T9SS type A sorting domain-containing protein [Calditrichota bacterium]
MHKFFTFIFFVFFLFSYSFAQIEIDGDLLDWTGIEPLTQGNGDEPVGDVLEAYKDFDLKDLYITHDTSNVYIRIDMDDAANFDNLYNFTNPPVFEFYMDTEIGDTTGFDWGWWNIAMNYYINFAPSLSPDVSDKQAELYYYTGNRMPTYAEGEFVLLGYLPFATNDDNNALEFAIPRDMVNFGSEFRPWVYSVADYQWTDGADQMPLAGGGQYMLKYDFWEGGSVYMHSGPQIDTPIEIDGDMLDWASIAAVDVDELAEDTGDMPTGPEFDIKDVYVTSDSNYFFMKIDIDPSGTFAGIYNNYSNGSAFQIFFDTNWGDTTGLGYGGFWKLPADYMVDLSAALHPDSTGNETAIWQYVADYDGAFEEFAALEGQVAYFAKNDDDNSVELAIPRAAINVDSDVRPWIYVVGDENWDNEEYWPNTAAEVVEPPFYALDYNFISGPKVTTLADKAAVTSIGKENTINIAKGFGLVKNYPNPFNPTTTIQFSLEKAASVSVEIFNLLGEKVSTLVNNQTMAAGERLVEWNGTVENGNPAASGVYFYKISTSSSSIVKKMVLVK